MTARFNPPPNWPTPPPGWVPAAGWQPDPSWGPPPAGWQLWVDEPARVSSVQRWKVATGVAVGLLVVVIWAGASSGDDGDDPMTTAEATVAVDDARAAEEASESAAAEEAAAAEARAAEEAASAEAEEAAASAAEAAEATTVPVEPQVFTQPGQNPDVDLGFVIGAKLSPSIDRDEGWSDTRILALGGEAARMYEEGASEDEVVSYLMNNGMTMLSSHWFMGLAVGAYCSDEANARWTETVEAAE